MSRYVAIDTETTGLDPEHDEVIEVAAIAFDADGTPGRVQHARAAAPRVPYHIERLTGIEAGSVETAPLFASIATELAEFIGDSPIIGQSVEFDLKFLAQGGVWPAGPVLRHLRPGAAAAARPAGLRPARHRRAPRRSSSRCVTAPWPTPKHHAASSWSCGAASREHARLAAGRARTPGRRGRMVARRPVPRDSCARRASDGFDLTAGLTTELLAPARRDRQAAQRRQRSSGRRRRGAGAAAARRRRRGLLPGVRGAAGAGDAWPRPSTRPSPSSATSSSRRAPAPASRWPTCCPRRCRRCVAASASSSPPTRSACRSS